MQLSLPALQAGNRARSRRLARHVEHSVARLEPDRARRAGRGRCRRTGRTPRRRRAAVAALVPAASRRCAGRGRADKARAARQAAHPRDASADDRSGIRRRLRQIRRFNETFRQLFGRSPRELRRTTAPEFSTAAAGELVLLLRYQPPYDWNATIAFLRQRAISGIEHVSARLYARTLQLDGLTGR
jgi:hypothetical protein